jgi:hypothetical protein
MPCATLHAIVHLLSREMLEEKFPAVASIKFSQPGTPEHYSLWQMIIWVTLPYAIWQLSYHFLITVRKRSKIAAGNPTSFTFLRKSYAKTLSANSCFHAQTASKSLSSCASNTSTRS